ncbi:MAG: Gfo/Idh/MocA family oxidoreductase [Deltaproteobacteria bacterium]|nr:Gfo/Idh/MocA family oxidoreductase [Deltaproteobacteria bacterium]
MVRVGCIGLGYWGKNLVRNFVGLPGCSLAYCCDLDASVLEKVATAYPSVRATVEAGEVFTAPEVDAVVIATPPPTHAELVARALGAGKHVFVEKPLALTGAEAERLVALAAERGRKLMVGHLLKYHPAVQRIRELILGGELGRLYYIYSQRVNLGQVRNEENALWSLGPHDVSVILYLLDADPERVSAWGRAYLQEGVEDVVFLNLLFSDGRMANVQLSWLDPHKIRRMTVVGTRKMVVFDDMEGMEKIKVYDKGVDYTEDPGYPGGLTLRFGDIYIPRVDATEPLRLECEHFLQCVEQDRIPFTDGQDGLRVVRVLEAAQKSIAGGGGPIPL